MNKDTTLEPHQQTGQKVLLRPQRRFTAKYLLADPLKIFHTHSNTMTVNETTTGIQISKTYYAVQAE
jgi:hypothetical protein